MDQEEELDFGEDELFNQSPTEHSPDSTKARPQPTRTALTVAVKEDANLFTKDGIRLPPHWLSKTSASTGDTYYKDTRTSTTHWEIPQLEWDQMLKRSDTPPLASRKQVIATTVAPVDQGARQALPPQKMPTGPAAQRPTNTGDRFAPTTTVAPVIPRREVQSASHEVPSGPRNPIAPRSIAPIATKNSNSTAPASTPSANPTTNDSNRWARDRPLEKSTPRDPPRARPARGGDRSEADTAYRAPVILTGASQFAPVASVAEHYSNSNSNSNSTSNGNGDSRRPQRALSPPPSSFSRERSPVRSSIGSQRDAPPHIIASRPLRPRQPSPGPPTRQRSRSPPRFRDSHQQQQQQQQSMPPRFDRDRRPSGIRDRERSISPPRGGNYRDRSPPAKRHDDGRRGQIHPANRYEQPIDRRERERAQERDWGNDRSRFDASSTSVQLATSSIPSTTNGLRVGTIINNDRSVGGERRRLSRSPPLPPLPSRPRPRSPPPRRRLSPSPSTTSHSATRMGESVEFSQRSFGAEMVALKDGQGDWGTRASKDFKIKDSATGGDGGAAIEQPRPITIKSTAPIIIDASIAPSNTLIDESESELNPLLLRMAPQAGSGSLPPRPSFMHNDDSFARRGNRGTGRGGRGDERFYDRDEAGSRGGDLASRLGGRSPPSRYRRS